MNAKSKSAGGGWLAGCLALAFLALLLGGGIWIFARQIPDVTEQLPPNVAPLIVTLTEPLNGQAYPLSAALAVRAEAIGEKPITVLELWVDGALRQNQPASAPNLTSVTASWTWSTESLGEHTLLTRAVDADGRVGQSNIVRLKAIEDAGSRLLYTAQPGDSAATIAQKFKVTPQQIIDLNPQPIAPGKTVTVPIPPPPPPPAAPSGQPPPAPPSGPAQPPSSPPNKNSVWFNKNILNLLAPSKPPAAPDFAVKADQCGVNLFLGDNANNEDGFFIYRLDPNASAFKRIATLGANTGALPIQYGDSGLSGHFEYYAASFNAAGESPSKIIGVNIGGAICLTPYWKGLQLEKPQPDVQSADKVYLYLSVNDGAWQRVPQDPHEFLDLKKSSLDQVLNSLAPVSTQGTVTIQGEVWGWKSGALTFLGNFKKPFPQDPALIEPIAGQIKATEKMTDLQICSHYNCPTDVTYWGKEAKTITLTSGWPFSWSPGSQVTSGLWQISTQPFPPGPTMSPPGLVLVGKADAPSKGFSYKWFSIDFTPLLKVVQVLSPIGQPTADPNTALPLLNLQKSGGQARTDPGTKPLLFGEISKDGAIDYYVRILPMQGNQPAGDPSNIVVLHYVPSEKINVTIMAPPPPPPEVIHFNVEIAEFKGMKQPNYGREGCVIVTGYDPNIPILPMTKSLWEVGSIRCPEIYQGGTKTGFAGLWEALGDAVNFVADLYNKLTDFVVDLAAKLNPLCAQAKLVTNPDDVDKVCKFVAKIAVEAGKAYLGLPPSLPNYDQLTSLGKDYLADLAAKELESNGIPCPDACKDLMKQGIDATTQQINQSKGSQYCEQSKAGEHGWKPFCIPAGVLVKPDPEGEWQMPMLVLKVTRKEGTDNPNLPQPVKCSVNVSNDSTNDYWVKQGPYTVHTSSGYDWKPETLKGPLFKLVNLPVPLLAPKQSVNIPISLVPVGWGGLPGWEQKISNGAWLPGHYEAFKKIHTEGWPMFDDWNYYYEGAMVKIRVGGSCELAGYEEYYSAALKGFWGTNLQPAGKTMQGQEKTYGPLGY